MLSSLLDPEDTEEEGPGHSNDELECIFIVSVYNSLGASIIYNHRQYFDALVKKITGFMVIDDSYGKKAGYRK